MPSNAFYDQIAPVSDFASLLTGAQFTPVPDDWLLGVADIVDSTGEIARGRYKTVNMLGASVISAMVNAMGHRAFPYVFGGDGASFAIAPEHAGLARTALAQVRRWAQDEFGIPMRAALLTVQSARAAGHDVRVARFAPSQSVDYAMFTGGGLAWAEAQMKSGAFAVAPAADAALPDLTGLSCRWSNQPAVNGTILSLVVQPAPGADPQAFNAVAARIVALADGLARAGHPIPGIGPALGYPPPGLMIDAHVSRGRLPVRLRALQLLLGNLLAGLLFALRLKIAGFDAPAYRAAVGDNADFRKVDDGLKLTLDCDPATRDRIRALLERAQAHGILRFGLFEQAQAMVTCFVPSAMARDHVHFVDGAAGGYASAAAQIKTG